MDADFSHDPAALTDLIAPIVDGSADLASGLAIRRAARSSTGGSGGNISRGGSLFARTVLGLGPRDLDGRVQGAWRSTTLASVPFDGVHAGGYVFRSR